MNDKESAIYATGYWNGIAYKRMRELSDEEIKEFITVFPIIFTPMDLLGFARAILKLASEK